MSLGWNKVVNMLNFHVNNYIFRTLRQNNTLFVTNMWPSLHDAKNIMVSASTKRGCYVSILNIIQGEIDPSQVLKAFYFKFQISNFKF